MGYSLAVNLWRPDQDIFGFFTKPIAYMIISGFIIARHCQDFRTSKEGLRCSS